MSEEIVLWKLKDQATGNEMDIKTPYVVREKQIPQRLRIPLYVQGVIISDDELAALGLERVGYTQDQVDEMHYSALYEVNPDLETRVRQYKGYLDELGLEYTATLDEITTAIEGSETLTDTEKTALALKIKTVYDAITTNLEYCGSETPLVDTCEYLAKLIQYLPEATEEETATDESEASETTEETETEE
ncbi:MAG: hypothetical protein PHH77_10965 [Victivallaceae bacterium]|nr:hypothetical protein [Victivallaceae bacterium]